LQSMTRPLVLAERHNLYHDTLFRAKSTAHSLIRGVRDMLVDKVHRWPFGHTLSDASIIATSESGLWYADDNERNWILTAGKVQNLRVAARRLNGIEVPGGSVFSFWRHIGMPAFSRGYVVGREIREGCLVPTVAGGLCQLSNALYDAALKAGLTIAERHRHSRVVPGSLAERDRDATVKWNYVDLRFTSTHPFRIEVDITNDKLIVRIRGTSAESIGQAASDVPRAASKLNDCYSCGNLDCHRHAGDKVKAVARGITAFLVDDRWSEFDRYITGTARPGDLFLLPFLKRRPVGGSRYAWTIPAGCRSRDVLVAASRRAISLRLHRGATGSLPPLLLKSDERIAQAMMRHLPVECTHLVIAQNLLPFLWREGALGGRTFDVLMTRMPMERLHQRLDMAGAQHPDSLTAVDYRAPLSLIDLESAAITKARNVISPHAEIAGIFNNKTTVLDWSMPPQRSQLRGTKVLFPASALARKGAYEMRDVARALDLHLVVTGRDLEGRDFWKDVRVERAGPEPFNDVGVVVLPSYVEHQPRMLLRALASGIPVITTVASGLAAGPGVTIIPMGDVDALAQAVAAASGRH
jgi:hypothetical protein